MQVQTLRLGWCHLGSTASVQAVGELVSFCTSLVNLDLRGNGFGDSGKCCLSSRESSYLASAAATAYSDFTRGTCQACLVQGFREFPSSILHHPGPLLRNGF